MSQPMSDADNANTMPGLSVAQAIASRHSIRAYSNKPVSKQQIEQLLSVARYAPSGTNTQPWRVYVLAGGEKDRFTNAVSAAFNEPDAATKYREEYPYYPVKWQSPFIERRRKVGWDLYGLLGIGKTDKEKMHAQHAKNFRFFDAPIGLIFTIDRVMQQGSWMDYGMFLQNIMIGARGMGLDTCPQAAFTQFHSVIRAQLQYPDNEMLVCGMSLGYADATDIANTLRTEREPVESFTSFYGFE
jgi:nitroreductase